MEKRQISVCKQIFIPFSYYSKNRLNISKIVPLLSGNLASNKAKQGHIIRQPSHQRGQPRSKARRNYKIKKLFFAAQWSFSLCSLFWYHQEPPLGMGAKYPIPLLERKENEQQMVCECENSVYLFWVFLVSAKTHLFCKKRNIKRWKVCHLLFKTAWIFKIAPLARR